jgi:hypothetical protein
MAGRSVAHPVLGPAVLRLKLAMMAMLAAALTDFALSGLTMPDWFRYSLLGGTGLLLVLLLAVRRASVAALILTLAILVLAMGSELTQSDVQAGLGSLFGPLALLAWTVEAIAIAQAIPAARRLARSGPRTPAGPAASE